MKSPTIQSYVSRLISCGIPKHEAVRTVCSFLKEFDETELRKYVESIEKDMNHVDQIKIEQQSGNGKLSIAEIEYADKLAHLKKNLLRADELMDAGYSGDMRRYPSSYRAGTSYDRGTSYDDRGRGSRAQRDSRGRYSSGRGYSRYVRDDYSMAADEVVADLTELMESAPNDMMRKELQRIKKKVEEMDD